MATPQNDKSLTIGKDIPWEAIERRTCLVNHFTPFGTINGVKIIAPPPPLPYALLSVELPELRKEFPTEVSMPVLHKEDFRNLWKVFQERGVKAEEEVLVFYMPILRSSLFRRLFPRMTCLHIYIFPKGHAYESSTPGFRPDNPSTWNTPIDVWHPKGWRG